MPDLLVISLLVIGPIGIWFLLRFLNKAGSGPEGKKPPASPEG